MVVWWSAILFLNFILSSAASGEDNSPEIYFLHIKSDVKYRFATTLVTSKVVNPDDESREVVFDVTLPNEAFMTNFTLEIGDKIHVGEVKEKEEAKKQFKHAQSQGQSAGLITAKPRETNKFNIHVNVEAMGNVTFNLTYKEILRRKIGTYSHVIYVDPGQPVDDLQVEVAIEESRDITTLNVPPIRNDLLTDVNIEVNDQNDLVLIQRPTAQSAYILYRPSVEEQVKTSETGISGQFIVEYDVEREADAGDLLVVNGYFVHFFGADGLPPLPKDVVFILDKSGSMFGTKIQQLREAMLNILDEVDEGDRFNIITFNGQIHHWTPGELLPATEENINAAKDFVSSIPARGSTNIDSAMTECIELLAANTDNERARVLIFLTDGQPTAGETNTGRILGNVARFNELEIPIFTLAFGNGADYGFLKKMSAQNNGFARKIYEDSDADLQIEGFYDEISTVLLKNVTFTYLNDAVQPETLTKTTFNHFFSGTEIMVAGRLMESNAKHVGVSVSGESLTGLITLTLPNELIPNNELNLFKDEDFEKITENLWAYLTIKQKLKQKEATTSVTEQEELKEEILRMSLKYNFVTPLTSMVVTLTNVTESMPLDEVEDNDNGVLPIAPSSHSVQHNYPMPGGSTQYFAPNPMFFPLPYRGGPSGSGFLISRFQGFPAGLSLQPYSPRRLAKTRRPSYTVTIPRTTTSATTSTAGTTTTTEITTTETTTTKTTPFVTDTTTTVSSTQTPIVSSGKQRKEGSVDGSFIVKINGIREPLCLNLGLSAGKTYKLFEDVQTGTLVSADFDTTVGSRINRRRRRRKSNVILSAIDVKTNQQIVHFEENHYIINGTKHSWNSTQSLLSKLIKLDIHPQQGGDSGLKIYADASSTSGGFSGLLETFASIRGKIIKIKTRGKGTVAKLKFRRGRKVYKLRARWLNNPVRGVMSCWSIKRKFNMTKVLNMNLNSLELTPKNNTIH